MILECMKNFSEFCLRMISVFLDFQTFIYFPCEFSKHVFYFPNIFYFYEFSRGLFLVCSNFICIFLLMDPGTGLGD
jgi:hypothetical protein